MVEKKTLGLTKESLAQLPFLDVGSGPIDLVPSWLQLLLQAGLAQETKGKARSVEVYCLKEADCVMTKSLEILISCTTSPVQRHLVGQLTRSSTSVAKLGDVIVTTET
ncbi:hypothetical protein ABBQ38_010999 [Trebouxia sp. C0009 RCD-2024]